MFCCRIVPSIKPRMTPLSVLFTRETSICQGVAAAASDGSSLFNGVECSGPLPVDAVLWIGNTGENNHRPGFIEGYCNNIHKGKIRVGINIGNCAGYGNSNGQTGWNSVSRLIIEEVPPSQ